MLGFYNLVYQNPAVDRVQCMIKIQPDGTLTLVGCGGKAPTLVRNFDGQWNPLYKGQVTQIRPGDFVSLDCNNPDSAVFECWGEPIQQQQQQQQGDIPPSPIMNAAAPPPPTEATPRTKLSAFLQNHAGAQQQQQ